MPQRVLQGVQVLARISQEVLILQHLVHDDPQDSSHQDGVGPRLRSYPHGRVASQLHLSRVDDDELRSVPHGALHRDRRYVVLLSGVGADDQDGLGVFKIPNRVGGCLVSQRLLQGLRHLRPGVGGVVDVVGAHDCAGELLQQVVLLVGASVGSHGGELVALVLAEPLGYQGDCLFPGGLLQDTVASYQGSLQASAAVDEFEAELPLEAGLAVVGLRLQVRDGADHLAALVNLQLQLASHRAVRAGGGHALHRLLPLVLRLHQRAHRANVDARAAELAAGLQKRGAMSRPNQGDPCPLRKRDCAVDPYLLAGPYAAPAHDAQVVVHVVEGVFALYGQVPVFVVQGRRKAGAYVQGGVLELAPVVLGAGHAPVGDRDVAQAYVLGPAQLDAVAGEAAVGVLRYHQLRNALAQRLYLLRVGPHHHVVGHGRRARGGSASGVLNLDHAHAARPVGFHSGVVAKVRDVQSGIHGRLYDRFTRLGPYFLAVYDQAEISDHSSP